MTEGSVQVPGRRCTAWPAARLPIRPRSVQPAVSSGTLDVTATVTDHLRAQALGTRQWPSQSPTAPTQSTGSYVVTVKVGLSMAETNALFLSGDTIISWPEGELLGAGGLRSRRGRANSRARRP